MEKKTINMLSNEALIVLENATVEIDKIKLNSGNLERGLYKEIDEVLRRIGGKWNGRKKVHEFSNDPKLLLKSVIETKEMPPKNPTAFFPTPKALAKEMLRLVNFTDLSEYKNFEFRILEPSAGTGSISDAIKEAAPNADLDTVEILPINQNVLKSKGYAPYCGDFMQYNTDYTIKYDYIFMNPPFSLERDSKAYITHVNHAFNMLKNNGALAAIIPTGFIKNKTKKEIEFFEKLLIQGNFYKNEDGAFKESGTMVETCIAVMQKDVDWKYKNEYNGHKNYFLWLFGMYSYNEEKFMKMKEELFASNPDDNAYLDYVNLIIEEAAKRSNGLDKEFIPDYINYLKREYAEEHPIESVDSIELDVEAILKNEKENYGDTNQQAKIIADGGNLLDIMLAS